MTAFALIGLVMALAAVSCVVMPLVRSRDARAKAIGAPQTNLALLKDQLVEMDADLASGGITPGHYESARAELEQRVLEETRDEAGPAHTTNPRGRWTAAIIGLAIPLLAVAMYSWIGQPGVMRPAVETAERQVTPAEIEEMVGKLAERLEKNPDDPRGWMMLARSYYVMQRMPEAAAAYAKAAEKVTNDADLLADYADALAMSQGKSITGKPLDLVHQALKLDPAHPKALAMAGTEAFYRKDYGGARAYWERLLPLLPPESEMAKSVAGGIAEARELSGMKAVQPGVSVTKPAASSGPATGSDAGVSGQVTLSPALAAKAAPNDTVFVVARAVNGPRIPLAVLRRQVADLPLKFTLDDSLAMSPELKLSSFPEVTVTARISKSGNAMSQSGDLQGTSPSVKVGAKGLAIVIDSTVP